MRRYTQAFTLIELLIVVAIIAILAAIAVPNFLEAQVRSKVARVNNDLRTLATAIESYAVDNNVYPMHMLVEQTTGNQRDPWIAGHPQYGAPPGSNNEFHFSHVPGLSITTPISYISSIPEDPFHLAGMPIYGPSGGGPTTTDRNPIVRQYLYGNSKHGSTNSGVTEAFQIVYGAWRTWSGGPGFTRRDVYIREGAPRTSMTAYDATNGTISSGAIWRTQRNPDGGRPLLPGYVE